MVRRSASAIVTGLALGCGGAPADAGKEGLKPLKPIALEAPVLRDRAVVSLEVAPNCTSGGQRFSATVAASLEVRAQGLADRREPLAPGEAMLFVFDPPEIASFWMKDTFIPLELAYFDSSGKLMSVHRMPVEGDPANPRHRYDSSGPVAFALEVAPGSLAETGPDAFLCIAP